MEEFVHTHNNRDEYVCSLATRAHLLFDVRNAIQSSRSFTFCFSKNCKSARSDIFAFFIFIGLRFWYVSKPESVTKRKPSLYEITNLFYVFVHQNAYVTTMNQNINMHKTYLSKPSSFTLSMAFFALLPD